MTNTILGLDAGHPSYQGDTGTLVGHDMTEAEWTLAMVRHLCTLLAPWPIDVVLLRNDHVPMSLMARASNAVRLNCDLVLSLHVNSNENTHVDGLMTHHIRHEAACISNRIMEAYSHDGHYWDNVEGLMVRRRKSVLSVPHNWTRDTYAVLRNYTMPAVLVECLFASNISDRRLLHIESSRNEINAAIISGVAFWLHARA